LVAVTAVILHGAPDRITEGYAVQPPAQRKTTSAQKKKKLPAGEIMEFFSLLHGVQKTGSGAHPASYPMETGRP